MPDKLWKEKWKVAELFNTLTRRTKTEVHQRSRKGKCLLFFHQILTGFWRVFIIQMKILGLFARVQRFTLKWQFCLPSSCNGIHQRHWNWWTGTFGCDPGSPVSTCSTLHTGFPQHFIENGAFGWKLTLPGSLIPCTRYAASISLQIKKN